MQADVEELKQQLAARFRELQEEHRLSGVQLEKRTTYARKNFGWIRNAGPLPARHVLVGLDKVFKTGSELTDLGERIRAAQAAKRLRDLDVVAETGGTEDAEQQTADEEVVTTDRRQFAALSAIAIDTVRRIDTCGTSPTLGELEDDVLELAHRFDTTPHPDLLLVAASRWRQVEEMLDRRLNVADALRTTRLGGRLTYYLGRLAFGAGHYRDARRFCDLSERYAEQIGDDMLTGSLAALRSSIAYYTQRWDDAATAAGTARRTAPGYLVGRLAAYEARSFARLKRRRDADNALQVMREHVGTSTMPRPGSAPFTPGSAAMFSAVCAVELGDGAGAAQAAREAIDLIDPRHHEERSHAHLCLATAHLMQDRPDPAAAIAAGRDAVAIPAGHLSATIVSALAEVVNELAPWASDPEVHTLAAVVHRSRLALPGSPA